jgi:hypothetical protein
MPVSRDQGADTTKQAVSQAAGNLRHQSTNKELTDSSFEIRRMVSASSSPMLS